MDPENEQHRYPRRHRSAPIRYGIDKYADAVFLSASQIEEPKCIERVKNGKKQLTLSISH